MPIGNICREKAVILFDLAAVDHCPNNSHFLPAISAYIAIPVGGLILLGWIVAYIKCGFCRLPN